MRLLLAPILNSLLFLHSICFKMKVLEDKKFDLAIIKGDIIIPRILSIRGTELNLYSVCAELS